MRIIFKRLFKILAKHVPGNKLRIALFRGCGYPIGKDVYIGEGLIVSDELRDLGNLIVEDRVSIAPRVTIVTASSPNFSKLITYIGIKKANVIIKHDAWIGTGAIILPGVTIGEFAIIGAGSVVINHVPPYTVVAGVPAKFIKKLAIKNET